MKMASWAIKWNTSSRMYQEVHVVVLGGRVGKRLRGGWSWKITRPTRRKNGCESWGMMKSKPSMDDLILRTTSGWSTLRCHRRKGRRSNSSIRSNPASVSFYSSVTSSLTTCFLSSICLKWRRMSGMSRHNIFPTFNSSILTSPR
jgi:hypothetical protein